MCNWANKIYHHDDLPDLVFVSLKELGVIFEGMNPIKIIRLINDCLRTFKEVAKEGHTSDNLL